MNVPTTEDVRALFDDKARSWQKKYGRGGTLNCRIEECAARLFELCRPPAHILDLGCGTGDIGAALAAMGYQVAACDIAGQMIEIARQKWAKAAVQWVLLPTEWTALPFEAGSFRGVLSSSVFEYLPDVEHVVRELSRVLLPGGVLIFSVPNSFSAERRVEAFLRQVVLRACVSIPARIASRMGGYARYLRLSKNRFTGDQWQAVLARAGLSPVDGRDFAADTWRRQANIPLIFLAARKMAPSGRCLRGMAGRHDGRTVRQS